jgi:hypothetical protein
MGSSGGATDIPIDGVDRPIDSEGSVIGIPIFIGFNVGIIKESIGGGMERFNNVCGSLSRRDPIIFCAVGHISTGCSNSLPGPTLFGKYTFINR